MPLGGLNGKNQRLLEHNLSVFHLRQRYDLEIGLLRSNIHNLPQNAFPARISIRYWTHTASGVTLADIQMAQKIDPLF
jgi:hypothetical protein